MNMSHCRFENTLEDLMDCIEHLEDDDDDLSEREKRCKKRLIEACLFVAGEMGWVEEDMSDDEGDMS